MRSTKHVALFALALLLLIGCIEEKPFDKYARPDWLAGKVFTQLSDTAIFTTFSECLIETGFDTIINTSGSYTIFAPNNDAFDLFFQEHPEYNNSVSGIPPKELEKIVKYHIVQNPWTKDQLRSLDVWGWIDPTDETNDEPRGFKRETLLFDKNIKYGTRIEGNEGEEGILIVDTLESKWSRRVITDSRKFAPIFFKEYFDVYDLKLDDYKFYYGRSFEDNSDIFYQNGKILGDEIFAENGFIYNIDRVVTPALNAYQILEADHGIRSYDRFLEIVNLFPSFDYNQSETFDQIGVEQGLAVDSLFDLTFPELAFNITREKTKAPPGTTGLPGNVTIRYHHGMLAPTNEALAKLENDYLPGGSFWNGIDNAPENIKRIIANSHMSYNTIYETDLEEGFYNGEQDIITYDKGSVGEKIFGSNAGFLGLDDPIVPRAFSSVTGPIYLRPGYYRVMLAIEQSGLLSALKRERDANNRYMLFVEQDQYTTEDSSLLYEAEDEQFFAFQIAGATATRFNFSKNDLRMLLLNHIATREPTGVARKEFIPNLAGNHIIFNNETGEVKGTANTTKGYSGASLSTVIPKRIDLNGADNGSTWEIDDWFSFSSSSLYILLQARYPAFHNLILSSGLANTKLNQIKFVSQSENYTVFAPTAGALADVQADTLEGIDLERFIKAHFIRRDIIFTDGFKSPGYYETMRPDETSSEFNIINSKIYLEPGINEINFRAADGSNFATVVESDSTNILAGQLLSEGQVSIPVYINNAVIHSIDKALVISELDSK